jgi:hypothetical protein
MANIRHLSQMQNCNKLACENYRGTSSLLNVVYKVFIDMLAWRIKVYTDEILASITVDLGKVTVLLIIYL